MLKSEQTHAQEAEAFYREWLKERVRADDMDAEEALERLSRFAESA